MDWYKGRDDLLINHLTDAKMMPKIHPFSNHHSSLSNSDLG